MTDTQAPDVVVTEAESLRGQILDIIHDELEAEYIGTYIAGMDTAAEKIAALIADRLSTQSAMQSRIETVERYLRRARRVIGSKPSKIADDIDVYFATLSNIGGSNDG